MRDNAKIKVGISVGDINGIGVEIILKALSDNRMLDLCTPIIYAHKKVLTFYIKQLGIDKFNFLVAKSIDDINPKKVNLIQAWEEEVSVEPGTSNKKGGKYALLSLKAACTALKNKEVDLLVTAPINKDNIQSDDFRFTGHTEYLHSLFGQNKTLMLLISEELKVALVTGHISISEVANKISKENILESIESLVSTFKTDFSINKPRIAVLGLNPHAGDNGLLGKEETDFIMPAIEQAKQEGKLVFGPFPADGFFGSQQYKKFDVILAMYHDQGLSPFKTISFNSGVNFTSGLSVIRTSPDHGTAYEIAGQNLANSSSFRKAMFTAIDLYRNRVENKKLHDNKLQKSSIKKS